MPDDESLCGYCKEMCPESERKSRLSNNIVHRLESRGEKMVKKFTRSAADVNVQAEGDEIRSPEVCLRTARYLIKHVLSESGNTTGHLDKSRYHFVFDRLRSVRQDLVVGNSRDRTLIRVMEISVRFHLYSGYRLCLSESPADFDPHINFSHLLECLKNVLVLYDELGTPPAERSEMSAVYLMLNLGSPEAERWAAELSKREREQPCVELATRAFRQFSERNFVGVFKTLRKMPKISPILAFHWKWPNVMRDILDVMNVAYSSKACRFPLRHFCSLFAVADHETVRKLCGDLGIQVTDEGQICFLKSSFNRNTQIRHFQDESIENRLRETPGLYDLIAPLSRS